MDLTQLKYFQTLARLEHSTRAAEQLHIAQPALSRSMRKLEDELGLPLFDRVGRGLKLNENGRILLRHTNAALLEIEDAKRELAEKRGKMNRHVSVSMQAASKLLPAIIRGFNEKYPDVSLDIKQQDAGQNAPECDIVIFSSIEPQEKANCITLMQEEICLAMPSANPLSRRKSVALNEVAGQPFICLYKGKGLRQVTDEYCRMAGFQPEIVLESDNPGTVRELTALGVGLAFIPKITWRGVGDDPGISLVEISGQKCTRCINMEWRESGYVTKASRLFKNYLVEFFAAICKQG